ncbi:MAG: hypothetical protein QGF72_05660 [Candidatus Poseidoniaceae archaeon]|jgi:predicted transcriptional regulator|nr:hypothetical protein [Candidatus Poseidoniaceae archaeon]
MKARSGEDLPWQYLDGIITPPSASEVLKCLLQNGECTTQSIVELTGLIKGEVHSGLRKLRWRGWVSSVESVSTRPGRPPHLWALSISEEEMIQTLLHELSTETHILADAIRRIERIGR